MWKKERKGEGKRKEKKEVKKRKERHCRRYVDAEERYFLGTGRCGSAVRVET